MRFLKSLLSLIVLAFIFNVSSAQQVPMYSQYVMNGFLVNPSFAGRDGYTTVTLTTREQWLGLNYSPATYAASFQTRILKNSYISKATTVRKKLIRPTKGGKVGLGGYFFSDYNGIMRRTGFEAAYSYHIAMGQTGGVPNDLSFGLAFTFYQFAVNTNNQLLYQVDDPVVNNYDRSVFIPDFNFGASFTTSNYYVGLAMTNLLRGNLIFADTTNTKRTELGNFYLTGGLKIPINNDFEIRPSAFIKSSDMLFKSIQMDLTCAAYYKEEYWAGLSWRTGDAIIANLGLKYDRFFFGYAVDFTLTQLRSRSFGTHEITLAVKFGESARRYRWINAY